MHTDFKLTVVIEHAKHGRLDALVTGYADVFREAHDGADLDGNRGVLRYIVGDVMVTGIQYYLETRSYRTSLINVLNKSQVLADIRAHVKEMFIQGLEEG